MTDMIERVTQALRAQLAKRGSGDITHDMARAAIEAMREPTREQILAGWGANSNGGSFTDYPDAEGGTVGSALEYDNKGPDTLVSAYRAMIDAALAEKST